MIELIDEYNAKERFVAAAIIEPIQAEGGWLRPSQYVPIISLDLQLHNTNYCIV